SDRGRPRRAPRDRAAASQVRHPVASGERFADDFPRPAQPAGRRTLGLSMVGRLGRALKHRNYRLFFAGQGISVLGTWLTRFATVWMAYRLTGSALVLGLVGFFSQAPTSIIAPFAGVLVDRWDRHKTILVTQVAAMLQSAALAV